MVVAALVGAVLVLAVVVVVLLKQRREVVISADPGRARTARSASLTVAHSAEPGEVVFSSTPTDLATNPGVSALLGELTSAMEDGELTDEENAAIVAKAEQMGIHNLSIREPGSPTSSTSLILAEATTTATEFVVGGVTYTSVDDIPDPIVREAARKAMEDLAKKASPPRSHPPTTAPPPP